MVGEFAIAEVVAGGEVVPRDWVETRLAQLRGLRERANMCAELHRADVDRLNAQIAELELLLGLAPTLPVGAFVGEDGIVREVAR